MIPNLQKNEKCSKPPTSHPILIAWLGIFFGCNQLTAIWTEHSDFHIFL